MPKHYTTTAGKLTRSFLSPKKPYSLSTIHLIRTGPWWGWMANMALRLPTTSISLAKQSKGHHRQHCHLRPRREKRSRNNHRAQSLWLVLALQLPWQASCTRSHLPQTCHQPTLVYDLGGRNLPRTIQMKSLPRHHYLNAHLPSSSRHPHSTLPPEPQILQALPLRHPTIAP